MFYSTRHLWRLASLALIIYLAVTKIPWNSIEDRLRTSWRSLEWRVRTMGEAVVDGIEDVRREIRRTGR
jgi:hypothetical protein